MARWNFGYFNIILFLLTFARAAKVRWFRSVYRQEVQDKDVKLEKGQCPSIVAHSFGTYILGNALLKYDWLRFDKVVLCGAILPRDFPWNKLIDRGQVQAVRNEFGTQDEPTRFVKWFVAGTGPSGRDGFTCSHNRLEQERFEYTHSEYFDKGHMEAKWLPFLQRSMPVIPASELAVDRPKANRPWGLYLLYACLVLVVFLATVRLGLFARRGSDSRDRRTGEAEHITLDETSCIDVVQQAHRLRLSLNVKFPEISDPPKCCKDAAGLGRCGNGDVEVGLSSIEDLPYVIGLVRQSLEKQLGNGGDA